MEHHKDALILGCGYTGKVLARKLVGRGFAVTGTARSPSGAADLERMEGVRGAVWTADDALPPGNFQAVYLLFPPRGVDMALVAERVRHVERIVYCGSTSVYGPQGGDWVDEHSAVAPQSPWAKARVVSEAAIRQVSGMVVRAAGIYGPGRNVVLRLREGRLRNAGDPERPVNMIHVEDLAQLLMVVGEKGRPGDVYLGASGHPVPWRELAEAAVEILGVAMPERQQVPNDPNIRMFYEESKRCRPTRFAELGYSLQYPDSVEALHSMARAGQLD